MRQCPLMTQCDIGCKARPHRFQPLLKHSFEPLCCRLTLGANMNRRKLITLIGGTAFGWPVATWAQQSKMQRVGVVTLGDAVAQSFEAELREGLRQSGLVEGQTLQYESR